MVSSKNDGSETTSRTNHIQPYLKKRGPKTQSIKIDSIFTINQTLIISLIYYSLSTSLQNAIYSFLYRLGRRRVICNDKNRLFSLFV
jgi:hypothetical protein